MQKIKDFEKNNGHCNGGNLNNAQKALSGMDSL
jgi:hypothetical protein